MSDILPLAQSSNNSSSVFFVITKPFVFCLFSGLSKKSPIGLNRLASTPWASGDGVGNPVYFMTGSYLLSAPVKRFPISDKSGAMSKSGIEPESMVQCKTSFVFKVLRHKDLYAVSAAHNVP